MTVTIDSFDSYFIGENVTSYFFDKAQYFHFTMKEVYLYFLNALTI